MEDKKKVEVLQLIPTDNGNNIADNIKDLREVNSEHRDNSGKFVKGNKYAGNRKPIPPEIKQVLTSMVPEVVSKLHEILQTCEDPRVVLEVSKIVLDRVYGKPHQSLDVDAKTDTTIKIILDDNSKEWGK